MKFKFARFECKLHQKSAMKFIPNVYNAIEKNALQMADRSHRKFPVQKKVSIKNKEIRFWKFLEERKKNLANSERLITNEVIKILKKLKRQTINFNYVAGTWLLFVHPFNVHNVQISDGCSSSVAKFMEELQFS